MNLAKRGLFANNYKFFVGLSLAKLNAALKALLVPVLILWYLIYKFEYFFYNKAVTTNE
jgi:hypothetical protein